MPEFTVRVQLNGNPTYDEYQRLHSLMAGYAFFQSVAGTRGDGVENHLVALPHATYFGISANTAAGVRDILVPAIKGRIQNRTSVFVAETIDWASHVTP